MVAECLTCGKPAVVTIKDDKIVAIKALCDHVKLPKKETDG